MDSLVKEKHTPLVSYEGWKMRVNHISKSHKNDELGNISMRTTS